MLKREREQELMEGASMFMISFLLWTSSANPSSLVLYNKHTKITLKPNIGMFCYYKTHKISNKSQNYHHDIWLNGKINNFGF